jgi:acetoacetyl-CoA synthetase
LNKILWKPKISEKSHVSNFIDEINKKNNIQIDKYEELYEWSISNPKQFWEETWKYSNIISSSDYHEIVDDITKMPGAEWFSGAKLNFAENLLRFRDDRPAIHYKSENSKIRTITYKSLYSSVEALSFSLRSIGVKKGDRVAGYISNIPEAIIAMLATSSIGAIWSSTSPDFGVNGVLDRFSQIKPKVLFATSGYSYNGKYYDSLKNIHEITQKIKSLVQVVIINQREENIQKIKIRNSILYKKFISKDPKALIFEQLPFNYPLFVLYSSGTTGLPKSIVHSAGGTLIQHLKEHLFHCDLNRDDNIFYFTTCGWMMWNWLVSSLAVGSAITLYDGSPFYPQKTTLWKMVDELKISIFGTSAKFIEACMNTKLKPQNISTLKSLRTILSTGSPLIEECFDYVYKDIKEDILLGSISGGTDIISCFALSSPLLPVIRGELQCRGLGMEVYAYDQNQNSLIGEKGELVCCTAFPSMPIYFWNDPDGTKYKKAYFETFKGIWHHGDLISISKTGGVKIYGRSDTTLNPGGVRIGTAEIYRVLSSLSYIEDSLVVGQKWKTDQRIILFVQLKNNAVLGQNLINELKAQISRECSHRHRPSRVLQVAGIPYTMNGKKVELAIKQILDNEPVLNIDALKNPETLEYFKNIPELEKDD